MVSNDSSPRPPLIRFTPQTQTWHLATYTVPGAGPSYQWQIRHCWLQEQTAAERQCRAKSEELVSVKIGVKKSVRQPFRLDPCKAFQLLTHDRRTFDRNALRLVIPTGIQTTSCEAAKDANHHKTWVFKASLFFLWHFCLIYLGSTVQISLSVT